MRDEDETSKLNIPQIKTGSSSRGPAVSTAAERSWKHANEGKMRVCNPRDSSNLIRCDNPEARTWRGRRSRPRDRTRGPTGPLCWSCCCPAPTGVLKPEQSSLETSRSLRRARQAKTKPPTCRRASHLGSYVVIGRGCGRRRGYPTSWRRWEEPKTASALGAGLVPLLTLLEKHRRFNAD